MKPIKSIIMSTLFTISTAAMAQGFGMFGGMGQQQQKSDKTAREFTLNLTPDGSAQMVCFLPKEPNGKAVVGIPGGGYSVLSNSHEGTLASGWMNEHGIAYFVVNYRMPKGDRTIPIGDAAGALVSLSLQAQNKKIYITEDLRKMNLQADISHRSSLPFQIHPYVRTSPSCSTLSSRWTRKYLTRTLARTSSARKD